MPIPDGRNLTNFWDDNAYDDGYDSDGEIGPFYGALEEKGEKYYDEEDTIPEWYYNPEYDSEIFEFPDPVLEVATTINIPDSVETYGCNETGGN